MQPETASQDASAKIARIARELPYPPTPDIAGQMAGRMPASSTRWRPAFAPAWVTVAVVAIVGGLMAVPPLRAFVFEFVGIGSVRIETGGRIRATEFPAAEMASLDAVLSAPTSLGDARARTGHALPLPAYPSDLGEPDTVYHETLVDGWAVFMLWTLPPGDERARMGLAVIRTNSVMSKTNPAELVETTVGGQRAVWASGPHMMMLPVVGADWLSAQILVEGNVLIWETGDVTWRLESGLDIDEMRRIAESIGA